MTIDSLVAPEDLADSLEQSLTYDEIVQFVDTLDANIEDWDFTPKLFRWMFEQIVEVIEEERDVEGELPPN